MCVELHLSLIMTSKASFKRVQTINTDQPKCDQAKKIRKTGNKSSQPPSVVLKFVRNCQGTSIRLGGALGCSCDGLFSVLRVLLTRNRLPPKNWNYRETKTKINDLFCTYLFILNPRCILTTSLQTGRQDDS